MLLLLYFECLKKLVLLIFFIFVNKDTKIDFMAYFYLNQHKNIF